MRKSRGRISHTPGREHETPRGINRREEYEGERERGQSRPRGGDPEGLGGRNPYTPMLPGSGYRPRYTPEENPKPLEDMKEGRSMKGRDARGEGVRASVC